jgi:hypothetical protein
VSHLLTFGWFLKPTFGNIAGESNGQASSLNEGFVIFGSVADAILGMPFHYSPHFFAVVSKKIRGRMVRGKTLSYPLFHSGFTQQRQFEM